MKSQVELVVHRKQGKTSIDSCYFEQPFKLIAMPRFNGWNGLDVMLMSSSPGLLSGDQVHFSVLVKENASLRMVTQAYQRLFTSRTRMHQNQKIALQNDSLLVYAPHPVVPHIQSVYQGESEVHMGAGSGLVWSEVITCGRSARGEVFAFSSFRSRISIFLEGELLFLDNQFLDPGEQNLLDMGMMEGFSHQSLLVIISGKADLPAVKQALELVLSEPMPEGMAAVSDLRHSGLVVRILGRAAEDLFDLNNRLIEAIRPFLAVHES